MSNLTNDEVQAELDKFNEWLDDNGDQVLAAGYMTSRRGPYVIVMVDWGTREEKQGEEIVTVMGMYYATMDDLTKAVRDWKLLPSVESKLLNLVSELAYNEYAVCYVVQLTPQHIKVGSIHEPTRTLAEVFESDAARYLDTVGGLIGENQPDADGESVSS